MSIKLNESHLATMDHDFLKQIKRKGLDGFLVDQGRRTVVGFCGTHGALTCGRGKIREEYILAVESWLAKKVAGRISAIISTEEPEEVKELEIEKVLTEAMWHIANTVETALALAIEACNGRKLRGWVVRMVIDAISKEQREFERP